MRTLYGLAQSPWTQRARWALDHHGVTYGYREHLPMVGEVLLRWRARVKKASVPLLVDGEHVVMGSAEIARHAESIGRGAPLFLRERDDDITRWITLAERMLHVTRAFALRNIRESRDALEESMPSFVPRALKRIFAPTAKAGVGFLQKKYAVPADVDAEVSHVLRPALDEVRAALAGKQYLLDVFTFADIALATALQGVRPHDSVQLGPATRAAWTNERLAADFEDLLMWRDAVYRKHR